MTSDILAICFALACLAFGTAGIWLLFFITPRDHDEAMADNGWHKCAWCKCYYHTQTGIMRLTKPKYAPATDSHGICSDCVNFPANGTPEKQTVQ